MAKRRASAKGTSLKRNNKRASMREGPLADLFRSTEESVAPDEVKVTATSETAASRVEVAVADDGVEIADHEIQVERLTEDAPADQPEAGPELIEAPPAEERRIVKAPAKKAPAKKTPATKAPAKKAKAKKANAKKPAEPEATADAETVDEVEVIPDDGESDVTIEEATERETRSYRVVKEPVEHEGLERLMGGLGSTEEEGPAFGRDEPDTARYAVPRSHQAVLRVVGVGGAGVNAVNRMVDAGVPGVEFVAINTDLQSLQTSHADATLHIGAELTRGLGSGSDPRVGYRAAFEEQDKIKELLKGSDMVFLAAGSGGGTGTGAAPVVAKLAREVGALTVAAVTKPFSFEGARRMAQAEEGIAALGAEVDTMIVIPNERLLQILDRKTSITDAFKVADDVLRQAVQGISDLVMLPGLINLDFADVRTTMLDAGDAILGIGMGVGEHRAQLAAEKAVASPLLETSVEGAQSLLLSITGGPDLALLEASEAAEVVQEAAHPEANIIFGASVDEDMSEEVWVTVIATRFDNRFAHLNRLGVKLDGSPGESRSRPHERDDDGEPVRYADPAADWRSGTRAVTADEIYGEGVPGAGEERRSPLPRPNSGGRVLDVPEFIPGH